MKEETKSNVGSKIINYFGDHPLVVIILIIAALFTILIPMHKDRIEIIENKYQRKQTYLEQRIEILEKEKQNLKATNDVYFECLAGDSKSIYTLKNKLDSLISNEYTVVTTTNNITDSTKVENSSNIVPKEQEIEFISQKINSKDSYINDKLNIVIGVKYLSSVTGAELSIDANGKNKDGVYGVGNVIYFESNKVKYKLIIKKINSIGDYIIIEIRKQ